MNVADITYEIQRDELIPTAERFANKQFGVRFKGGSQTEREQWSADWNFCYHQKMNRLWAEKRRMQL